MTYELKPEWIDVVPSNSDNQLKGTLDRDDELGACAAIFEDRQPIIPRSDWRDIIENEKPSLRNDVVKIKNQRNEGSCTANAGTAGWENIHCEAHGKEYYIELSPISLYKRTGKSPNSGSTVGDNVRELRDVGALPTHAMKSKLEKIGLNSEHTMPETGFFTPFPNNWKETAKYFRIQEYFDIANIDGFFSALLSGFVVHYGRAGHSILGVEPVYRNNEFYCCYQNSWAPTWGDAGFGYDSENFIRGAINQYGAYAYRTVVWDDRFLKLKDNSLPKVAA